MFTVNCLSLYIDEPFGYLYHSALCVYLGNLLGNSFMYIFRNWNDFEHILLWNAVTIAYKLKRTLSQRLACRWEYVFQCDEICFLVLSLNECSPRRLGLRPFALAPARALSLWCSHYYYYYYYLHFYGNVSLNGTERLRTGNYRAGLNTCHPRLAA